MINYRSVRFSLLVIASLLFISFIDLSSAYYLNQTHGVTFTQNWSANNVKVGVRIIANYNDTIKDVIKDTLTNAPSAYILNSTKGVLAQANFTGNTATFSDFPLTAGLTYYFAVDNGTGNYTAGRQTSGVMFNYSSRDFNWTGGLDNAGNDANDSIGAILIVNSNSTVDPNVISNLYNTTGFETSSQAFRLNLTSASAVSSANLYWNNTLYSATVASLGSNRYSLSRTIDIPTNSFGVIPFFWNIRFNNGVNQNVSGTTQAINSISYHLCNGTTTPPYINFTFKNETSIQESISASIVSTWQYWLGSGGVNKTLSYTNSVTNASYAFCFSPNTTSLNTIPVMTYSNVESPQRTYSPGQLTLTTAGLNQTLFLLPNSLGQYVTFQVTNPAQQALSGVEINVSNSVFGSIESKITDSSGSTTFWLNPLTSYTVTAVKEGYQASTNTITPSDTQYTIQLSSTESSNQSDFTRGITTTVRPIIAPLNNDTTYNFNLTITSDYWSLESFGFTLRNQSGGTIFGTNSSSSTSGGTVNLDLNTVKNTTIWMDYFYVINGTYSNSSVYWIVFDDSESDWSLKHLFDNVSLYLTSGLFGLTTTGLAIIVFFIIFIFTGIMSYKFGISSPAAISAIGFFLLLFFDVGLGLVPNPVGAVSHFPTIFMAIIMIALFIKEASQ